MFNYWTRRMVNERLGLSTQQSYRTFPATQSGRIRSDSILNLLNSTRVGIDEPITEVPHDLVSADEIVASFSASRITIADIRRWTHRTRRPLPHFRINRSTFRFSAAMLKQWLFTSSLPHDMRRT